jgi:hypothetical protein
MNVTNAAILRLINAPDEIRSDMIAKIGNDKAIIAKAKEMMNEAPGDELQNKKLDGLIGECSFTEMKQRFGDAFEIQQPLR